MIELRQALSGASWWLQANIRAIKREQFKRELKDKPTEESNEAKFFDDRVMLRAAQRHKRSFKFHDEGKFVQVANKMRAKVCEKLFNFEMNLS